MPPCAVRSQHILVERVARSNALVCLSGEPLDCRSDSSWFYCHALALTDSQQDEVSSSASASAGDSSFCSHQLLLTAISAPSNFCSQQWGWRELWTSPRSGTLWESTANKQYLPWPGVWPFYEWSRKRGQDCVNCMLQGVKKVLAFPLEGLKHNDFHCWQGCCRNWIMAGN